MSSGHGAGRPQAESDACAGSIAVPDASAGSIAVPGAQGVVTSPCINICRMDARSGWCEGCLRTLDEIARWGGLADAAKARICADLPARRLALGAFPDPTR